MATSFAAAMGAGAGLLLASFLHIPWLQFPLMITGLIAGAALAMGGFDLMGGW